MQLIIKHILDRFFSIPLFIGDDSSVGMGSVVVKSLDNKKSCFGNPAKLIRSIKVGPKR